MWSRGVCAKTSREIADTMGKIMMASTTAATNTDPLGSTFSLNSGIQPILLDQPLGCGSQERSQDGQSPQAEDDRRYRREQVYNEGDRA